ncbi:hypothetical protein KCU92_g97, partial [Aureobasidium melanogenum]
LDALVDAHLALGDDLLVPFGKVVLLGHVDTDQSSALHLLLSTALCDLGLLLLLSLGLLCLLLVLLLCKDNPSRTLCVGSGLLLGLSALDDAFGHCCCWRSLGREGATAQQLDSLFVRAASISTATAPPAPCPAPRFRTPPLNRDTGYSAFTFSIDNS